MLTVLKMLLAVAWYAEATKVERDWRIDLYTEAIISADDDKRAERLANELLPLRRQIAAPYYFRTGREFGYFFDPRRPYEWHTGEEPFLSNSSSGLARAERCVVEQYSKWAYFLAVRGGVTERLRQPGIGLLPQPGEWDNSIILSNGPLTLHTARDTLIICDGDVVLTYRMSRVVVIANGDVSWAGGENTQVYAAGRVRGPEAGPKNVVRENLDRLPFGVRFFDLKRDYGLEVEAAKGELTVAADCPALKLLKGDVLIKVGGVVTDSAVKLREHLRRGAARGSVELVFRRGREWVTQTVGLDGFPYPRAPMPREAGR